MCKCLFVCLFGFLFGCRCQGTVLKESRSVPEKGREENTTSKKKTRQQYTRIIRSGGKKVIDALPANEKKQSLFSVSVSFRESTVASLRGFCVPLLLLFIIHSNGSGSQADARLFYQPSFLSLI
jgi:hypothetical protein